MRIKPTSFKLLFGGLLLVGISALLTVYQINPAALSQLPSFDRGDELPNVAELDVVDVSGTVQILDPAVNAETTFHLASADSLTVQTAAIREAAVMMAGPPCDVIDCAATGMPFTVTVGCGGLIQEAENGIITGGFTLGSDPAASNGQYVKSPTSVGTQLTPNPAQKVTYCFSVAVAGTYRIKTNVYAPGTSSDSFFVKVNDAPSVGYLWDIPVNTSYLEDNVADRGGADPVEVTLTVGDHTVDVFMRERAVRLDTISLELVPPPSGCGGLVQEAEDGTRTGFLLGSDAAASNGEYVKAPTSVGTQLTPNAAYKVSYCVSISQAGTYRIKTNVYAANANTDSFHVQVDGVPASGYLWDVPVNTSYLEDYVADRGGADPVEVTLSAGDHTIDVFMRERGARLDTIELEEVSTGGVCGGLVQEAEDGAITGLLLGSDAAASNGQYVQSPTSVGVQLTPNPSYKVSYCFSVSQAGTYRIKTNMYAANVNQDSFHVQVDSLPASGYLWDALVNTGYLIDYVSQRNGADPVEVTLTAGDHTVDVFMRERGTRLDTIALEEVSVVASAALRGQEVVSREHANVYGSIRVTFGDNFPQSQTDIDLTELNVRIVDAETNGQSYNRTVAADHHGSYFIEEMEPGRYIVALNVPDHYISLQPETVALEIAPNQVARVPFDLHITSGTDISSDSFENGSRLYLPIMR